MQMRLSALGAAIFLTFTPAFASAETHIVEMLNRSPDNPRLTMVFSPEYLQIAPGDTVRFVPTVRGHNVKTEAELIPEGAEVFESRIGDEIEVTFDTEGAYGYYCMPHKMMGMVGLIVVGDDPANIDAIRDMRMPRGMQRGFDRVFDAYDAAQ